MTNASMTYPRVLAVHEAAHAVVAIRLGILVRAVHLRTRDEVRRGDYIETERGSKRLAHGMVESSQNINPLMVRLMNEQGYVLPIHRPMALADIAVAMAGPYAEARYAHRSPVDVEMYGGGVEDSAEASAIAALLDDPREAFAEGTMLGRDMVRRHWADILTVADHIQRRRFTDGEEVYALLGA